jgi:hypothetical protein
METMNYNLLSLALALAALGLDLSAIHEAKAASWTTTGSLTTARYLHTATLLPNVAASPAAFFPALSCTMRPVVRGRRVAR